MSKSNLKPLPTKSYQRRSRKRINILCETCDDTGRIDKHSIKRRRVGNNVPFTENLEEHCNDESKSKTVIGEVSEDIDKKSKQQSSQEDSGNTRSDDVNQLQRKQKSQPIKPQSSKDVAVNTHDVKKSQDISISPFRHAENSHDSDRIKGEHVGKFNVQEKSDKVVCDIQDICQLPDGSFLMTDRYNLKLKRLNPTFELIGSYRFKSSPHSVCAVGANEAAVSMVSPNKINIITTGKKMKLNRSFNTSTYCRGMVFSDDLLYVCCGNVVDPCSGSIEVYTKSGKLHHRVYSPMTQALLVPVNITIVKDKQYIMYTSCNSNVITVIDLAWNVVKTITDQSLIVPSRLCTNDKGDQIYICDTNNNKVARFCFSNETIKDIYCENDGIKTPIGLCFDAKLSRLIVSCANSNELSVIQLNKDKT